MKMIIAAAIAATAFAASACAQTAPAGKPLVNWQGFTFYVFDSDTPRKSNCNEQCAAKWPPHLAAATAQGTGDWSVVARDDGTKQWAYKGKPLYTSKADRKAGDTAGDGVDGAWHKALP